MNEEFSTNKKSEDFQKSSLFFNPYGKRTFGVHITSQKTVSFFFVKSGDPIRYPCLSLIFSLKSFQTIIPVYPPEQGRNRRVYLL